VFTQAVRHRDFFLPPDVGEPGPADDADLPHAFVGVVIATLVLPPEGIASVRAAARDRVQVSFNLAYGSAIASIGPTVPAIAVAKIWLDGPRWDRSSPDVC
jgi:Ca2+/H+ antiporter